MRPKGVAAGLVRACHPGPTVLVTAVACQLGVLERLPVRRLLVLGAVVGSGQLSIGWSNDLIDRRRDLAVDRRDKPLVDGSVTVPVVTGALMAATVTTVVLGRRLGREAGWVHGVLVVGSGWAYNLGLKRTRLSVLPYVAAFGALPHVSALAAARRTEAWRSVSGGLLGVAAHCLNVLPDLMDDAATGVTGAPQVMGERGIRYLAVLAQAAATVVTLAGTRSSAQRWVAAASVAAPAAVVALRGGGKAPFRAVQGMAVVNAALLSPRSDSARPTGQDRQSA